MITLAFKPWRRIKVENAKDVIARFLQDVARTTHFTLRAGMEASRGGKVHRGRRPASRPGAYPAVQTGRLKGSIRQTVTATEATVGTNTHYAIYLRRGTRKMARRKMSDDALKHAVPIARARMGRFARFRV